MALLGHGAMSTVFDRRCAPSTLGSFCGRSPSGTSANLMRLARVFCEGRPNGHRWSMVPKPRGRC